MPGGWIPALQPPQIKYIFIGAKNPPAPPQETECPGLIYFGGALDYRFKRDIFPLQTTSLRMH